MKTTTPQTSVPADSLQGKLRGRRRRLYEGDRLDELCGCTSVKEVWNDLYPRLNETGRVNLQRHVRSDGIADLCSILYLLSPDLSVFYTALLRRFQLDNIQVLMRLFAGGREELDPKEFVPDLPDRIDVNLRPLLQASNLEHFIEQIPSDFASTAMATIDLYRSEGTTAFTEMALEKAWWSRVLETLEDLSRSARRECSPPILFELNSARLVMTLRAARAYDLKWETIQSFLPPAPPAEDDGDKLHFSDTTLEELFGSPEPDVVAERVPMVEEETAGNLVELESEMWDETVAIADHLYRTQLDGPSILVMYYYLKRQEIQNLIETIESVYYTEHAGAD